jgi:hypothetical protein
MFSLTHIELAKALHADRLRDAGRFARPRYVSAEPAPLPVAEAGPPTHPHRPAWSRGGAARQRDRHGQLSRPYSAQGRQ